MKKIFLMMIASSFLMACTPQESTTTTTTTEPAVTTDEVADAAVDTEESTMANDDEADVADEIDMAAGDGIEGMVESWDATGQTFTMMEGDKTYTVMVDDATEYYDAETAWDAEGFYGEDRMGQNIAVEGELDSATNTIMATKITRQ
ncbi:DUF5666 domain-containing protein [Deinococcus radiophilus]|uniref:DUF5666 domain-containing protein n=1 Tax=Deinococcus radiophilus TaxID=32062 RepID=A0A431VXX2_9DEIO|nr:DUF5666 domain-containing protein [Deinococcus radiophilus]RTR27993.1 hypothetical protein EJ104_05545 [Deinococcus radiophilus]UFA51562.1 hypothetical protein LMT64_12165 [Deinococcus radiophilus]